MERKKSLKLSKSCKVCKKTYSTSYSTSIFCSKQCDSSWRYYKKRYEGETSLDEFFNRIQKRRVRLSKYDIIKNDLVVHQRRKILCVAFNREKWWATSESAQGIRERNVPKARMWREKNRVYLKLQKSIWCKLQNRVSIKELRNDFNYWLDMRNKLYEED